MFCGISPIIGLLYKSLANKNVNMCQECFWAGKENDMYIKGHKVIELIVPYSPFARFMVTTKLAYDENKIMKRASKKIFFSFFLERSIPKLNRVPTATSPFIMEADHKFVAHKNSSVTSSPSGSPSNMRFTRNLPGFGKRCPFFIQFKPKTKQKKKNREEEEPTSSTLPAPAYESRANTLSSVATGRAAQVPSTTAAPVAVAKPIAAAAAVSSDEEEVFAINEETDTEEEEAEEEEEEAEQATLKVSAAAAVVVEHEEEDEDEDEYSYYVESDEEDEEETPAPAPKPTLPKLVVTVVPDSTSPHSPVAHVLCFFLDSLT